MLKRLFKKYPFFLVLLPTFILTHIEREYLGLIDYDLVYSEIIFIILLPPVVYAICWLSSRSHRKAGMLSLSFLLVYYFFGEVKDSIKALLPGSIWQSYIFLLIVFLIAFIIAAILIWRSKKKFEKTYLFVNTVLTFFVFFDIGTILWASAGTKNNTKAQFKWENVPEKPDVYYFIFDSYTSTHFLKEKFGFDNSRIDSFLVQKGFRLVPLSHSNYNLTPFSLGSTFHLDFLQDVDTTAGYYLSLYLQGVRKLRENPLFPALNRMGYQVYNHSIFDVRAFPTTVPSFDIWQLKTIYQQHNLWKKMDREIGWNFPRWMHFDKLTIEEYAAQRDRHDSIALSHIYETIKAPSAKPKFVYGHLFIPHSPYTFDSAGNRIAPIGVMSNEADIKAYFHQLLYVNTIMEKLVNEIQSRANRPTVIIIQGDHGHRYFEKEKNSWEFPNFNAFYFSNGDYRYLNDSLTNVNTFRVVANTFFNQQYPMLKGNRYFLQYK